MSRPWITSLYHSATAKRDFLAQLAELEAQAVADMEAAVLAEKPQLAARAAGVKQAVHRMRYLFTADEREEINHAVSFAKH